LFTLAARFLEMPAEDAETRLARGHCDNHLKLGSLDFRTG
jgi:hypothetical protein